MASHGDVTEIQVSHPDLGSRTFFPKAGEGNTFYKGGIVVNDDVAAITSAGDMIYTNNRQAGYFSVLIEDDQNNRKDSTFLEKLAGSSLPGVWTLSLINGSIYQGEGKPVGAFETNLNDGTLTLKVNSGKFKQIQ